MGRPRKEDSEELMNEDGLSEEKEVPQDPVLARLQALEERDAANNQHVVELQRRLSRAEFARGSKAREQQWDQMNDEDPDVKLGHVPSPDGVDPIIFTNKTGFVKMDNYQNVIDSQRIEWTTRSGVTGSGDLNEIKATLIGNKIPARINNWQKHVTDENELSSLRHKFQKVVVQKGGPAINTKKMLDEIMEKENTMMVNVTLSLDGGKSYQGGTFDLLFRLWNSY